MRTPVFSTIPHAAAMHIGMRFARVREGLGTQTPIHHRIRTTTMTDQITPKLEPEVERAIAIPDPRIRKLAKIAEEGEAAIANLEAIVAEKRANEGEA